MFEPYEWRSHTIHDKAGLVSVQTARRKYPFTPKIDHKLARCKPNRAYLVNPETPFWKTNRASIDNFIDTADAL